jgi:ElaA protein
MLTFSSKPYNDLTRDELYDAFALRQSIFIVEQKCPYNDIDGHDRDAIHLLGHDEAGALVAYARLLPAGIKYAEPSIGRVATSGVIRGTGAGKILMRAAIAAARAAWWPVTLRIGAQRYVERFYGELGFVPAGETYLEDGIPHVEMTLAPPSLEGG